MTARPATVPTLDTNQTNRTIPAPSKVTDGYVLNDILPSDAANYLWGWAGDWLTWLDERTADGGTAARDLYLQGVDAAVASGLGGGDVRLTTGAGDGVGVDGTFSWYVGATERAQLGATGMNVADGLVVGALSGTIAPVADRLHIGDASFYLDWDLTDPYLYFDANDYIQYDRSASTHGNWLWYINSSLEMVIRADGLAVGKGLVVGSTAIAPVEDRIILGDASFYLDFDGTDPFIYFDANDYIQYDRSASTDGNWLFYINSVLEAYLANDGLHITNGIWTTSGTVTAQGAAGGVGVAATGGSSDSTGVTGTGGTTNGKGIVGTGAGTGIGVEGTGGNSDGTGVKGIAGTLDVATPIGVLGVSSQGASTYGVKGEGTSGSVGVWGISDTGYGVIAEGDTTTPTTAALRVVPQDTDPSAASQGDLYVNSGDGTLRIYNGSAWVKVGVQT